MELHTHRPRPVTLWPGLMIVVAGAVLGDGALITSAYRGQSPVSDELLSFPWQGATAVTTSLIWGTAQLLLVLGLVVFARTAMPDAGRGRTGAWLAVVGGGLYLIGHALSVVFNDAALEDPNAIVVLTCFGVGTVLGAAGMMFAGVTMLRSNTWAGWRRFTPLLLGAWMVLMMPLQFTAALPVAVGVYAAAVIALGVALIQENP